MRPTLHMAAGKAWPLNCRGQKEFHFGSTWFCVRKEQRLTPDVWGQESLLLPSSFSCILSLSSNVSCLLAAGHSFRGDGVRKRWPPESLYPALQLPPGESNTSEEHPREWGAMECGAPARQHFLRSLICVPQPFPEREGGREGGPGAPGAAAAWCQLFVQTFEMFFSIKCRALYNFSAPHKTLDFCFRFPIAVTCADVSDSGQTSRHMCC